MATRPRRKATQAPPAPAEPPTVEPHIERPGPAEFRDPLLRREMATAAVWLGMALAIVGVIVLAQPLLLIIGGAIFAVFLDGGVRLLGRFIPGPRGWRLLLTILIGFGFIGWLVWFAGTTIAAHRRRRPVPPADGVRRVARPRAAGPPGEPGQPVARLSRPADQRGRQRDRRGGECDRDDRDRYLPRRRAPNLRPRH